MAMLDERSQANPHLMRTAELMAAAQSLEDVVDVLAQTARRIAGSDGIAVVLREEDVCAYVAEDAIEPLWKGCRFPLDICVSGWAMQNRETAVILDVGSDPRIPAAAYAYKAIRSLVMVPIGAPEPVAALGAYWCAMVWLDTTTVSRLEALAHQATVAVARLRAPQSAEPAIP
ncbi:UNVERIFIED_ORG: L-methionine (R)-S-oxide reductase [Methylobacterium sp. SuP10 SLI 274]|uniref:GAF domain-containing protein n=1 Tax=Methylorubrum extorquens TaxID=408 RepID=UPI00209CEC13|nr:GAF domain-containing protein [Methylorubrum extorquens]MDF9864087.1 L-methionine (R)-S-oxide reductase [Methylorubrum pseudosasae]MDH6637679.1 L-methionine (R)-S-oxide reductase [Methylobacterium sp. SuP10 SLI 274]MDH6666859.1 L-methionine (R)-S-oxide reductase [Methylorubrum zatmanii]MCP1558765.1 GAF domain-containing protein [Methylorubrum extorquens]MDF9792399.1 L-methionine (R)-S-oxide reductase [Methylorubrum extorquens]